MTDTKLSYNTKVYIKKAFLPKYMDSYNRLAEYLGKNDRPVVPIVPGAKQTSMAMAPVWIYKGVLFEFTLRPFMCPEEKWEERERYKEPLPVAPEIEQDFLICLRAERTFDAIGTVLAESSLETIRTSCPVLYEVITKMKEKKEEEDSEKITPDELRSLYERTEKFLASVVCFEGLL